MTDITPEAVEGLVKELDVILTIIGTNAVRDSIVADTIATLRALSAELELLRAEHEAYRKYGPGHYKMHDAWCAVEAHRKGESDGTDRG